MARMAWSWVFPFPQVSQALVKYLLLRADLVKKNRVLWHISKWSFPLSLSEAYGYFPPVFTVGERGPGRAPGSKNTEV